MAFQVLRVSAGDRILTMIGAAPEWLRLFLWPARLIMEYSPRYVDIAQGPSVSQLPGLLVLVGALGLAVACWRRSPVTSFGIGWIVVTLLPASNFILPAGFIIAERTLLLPSVGAVIAIASGIPWLYERLEGRRVAQYAATAAFALLLALGLARSYTRNRVWRDNYTLFHQAVLDAPDSYKAHYVLGTYLFENKRRRDGEIHYRRALELFPYDPVVLFSLADEYRLAGKCEPAIPLFRSAFEIAYTYRAGLLELSQCLLNVLDLSESKRTALLAIRFGAPVGTAHQLLAAANTGADSLVARRARGDTTYLRGTTLSSSK
jgi:protein O-mannosyl-transferase